MTIRTDKTFIIHCPTQADWQRVLNAVPQHYSFRVSSSTWSRYHKESAIKIIDGKIDTFTDLAFYQSEYPSAIFLEPDELEQIYERVPKTTMTHEEYEKYLYRINNQMLSDGFSIIYNKPNKPTMIQKLTNALKKALSSDLQSQYKAGFINGGLELTDLGKQELLVILADKYKTELTARAEEVIAEQE